MHMHTERKHMVLTCDVAVCVQVLCFVRNISHNWQVVQVVMRYVTARYCANIRFAMLACNPPSTGVAVRLVCVMLISPLHLCCCCAGLSLQEERGACRCRGNTMGSAQQIDAAYTQAHQGKGWWRRWASSVEREFVYIVMCVRV